MKTLKMLWAMLMGFSDDEIMVDHVKVPASPESEEKLAAARKKARQRHGKPFHVDKTHHRETPPSRDLVDIQLKNKKKKIAATPDSTVTQLKAGRG